MIIYSMMLTTGQAKIRSAWRPYYDWSVCRTSLRPWSKLLFWPNGLFYKLQSCFLNILPIPGLDGGYIFITLIEGAIRRPLTLRTRMLIQQAGTVLLLMLMISVMINDIGRLFGG